jgi:aspartate/methionine/tyrosine aminotransferase
MPDGAFYVWVNCAPFGQDAQTLADLLLDQAGVAIVPGADFSVNNPHDWLRVSYATSMDNLKEAVARMHRYLGRR